ncbi:glycosyltransferase family 10 domain-containing protein [Marinilabilia salmonicolor]|uniref:glycosyltransferase family 10 domain-containing protein n=1 Tax=Marinilabilia salmonicolor TaxID=989 RepID=UPI0004684FCA|nr:glycosyltransferase family 10 [Marinilabilia salmonicolor]
MRKIYFFIDQEIEDPDFWVVRNKHLKTKKTYFVSPENTILLTSEPRSIVNFPRKYRNQFGVHATCQQNIKDKNAHYIQPVLPWYVGYKKERDVVNVTKTYDDLKNSDFPEKKKLISVITSNKAFTKGHQDRIKFVKKLKEHYGDKIDVFGRGINDFKDKWDVLAPYKYHIAIENSSTRLYWTEKISDCFLSGTFPIYYGCPNISDYFPEGSHRAIDIHNWDEAIKTIDEIIENDIYEKNIDALKTSKDLVLEDYNIFNIIAGLCDKMDSSKTKTNFTLKPALTVLDWHNFYLYFFERNYYKLKSFFNKLTIIKSQK